MSSPPWDSYYHDRLRRLRRLEFARLEDTGEVVRVIEEVIMHFCDFNFFRVERIEDGPGVFGVIPAHMLYPMHGALDILAMEAEDEH